MFQTVGREFDPHQELSNESAYWTIPKDRYFTNKSAKQEMEQSRMNAESHYPWELHRISIRFLIIVHVAFRTELRNHQQIENTLWSDTVHWILFVQIIQSSVVPSVASPKRILYEYSI